MYHNTKQSVSEIIKIANSLIEKYPDLENDANILIEAAHKIGSSTLSGNFPDASLLQSLSALLQSQKIDFALIGGVAVSIHGVTRETDDIDVLALRLPDQTTDVEYMRKFNFYRAKSQTGTVLSIDHRQSGYCELLVANDDLKQYAVSTAKLHNVLGCNVKVVEPDALIGLKCRALANNPNRSNDKVDIFSVWQNNTADMTNVRTMLSPAELAIMDLIIK